jgi:hypothetical protein
MDRDIIQAIIEFAASLVLEGVVLGIIFTMISNKTQEKARQDLQREMNTIETQNRHNTELIFEELREIKTEIISQIKESKK